MSTREEKIVSERISEEMQEQILTLLEKYALDFWRRADRIEDFCVQYEGMDRIVFGGTNRVIWSIQKGFSIDTSFCTDHFLKANKEYLTERQKMLLNREVLTGKSRKEK